MSVNTNGFGGGISSSRFDHELPDEGIDGGESPDAAGGEERDVATLDPRTALPVRRPSRERPDGTSERKEDDEGDAFGGADGGTLPFDGGTAAAYVRRSLGGGGSSDDGHCTFGGTPASLEHVGGDAASTVYRNADGDVIAYHDDGGIIRRDADGEFFARDGETGEVNWSRDADGDGTPETIGRVGADGTTTSVISDTDGDGVPDAFTQKPLEETDVPELADPGFLGDGLTEDEANAAPGADGGDASPDGVERLAGDVWGNGIFGNADGDLTALLWNGDAYRENANGEAYRRTDGVISWSSEGAFGTVNPDGTTTTVELDTNGDGVPDTRLEDAVPLAGSNVDELLDQEGVFEGAPIELLDIRHFYGPIPTELYEPEPPVEYAFG